MKRRLAWTFALPLAVASALAGHALGYWIAVPDVHERAHALGDSGHGYLAYVPALLAACAAIVVLGFVAAVVSIVRRRHGFGPAAPAPIVAALPPLGFFVLELGERHVAGGEVTSTFGEPAFLAGLALQIPFALAAAGLALVLGRLARQIASLLGRRSGRRLRVSLPAVLPRAVADLVRAPVSARGYTCRGPPVSSR